MIARLFILFLLPTFVMAAGFTVFELEEINTAIAARPGDPIPLLARANSYKDAGEFNLAIKDYTKVIELGGAQSLVYYNRGWSCLTLLRLTEAMADFSKAIELEPDMPIYHHARGVCSWKLDKPDIAATAFSKAIDIAPDYLPAYLSRGSLRADMKDFSGALADFDFAISLAPDRIVTFYSRARLTYLFDRPEMADRLYRAAIDRDFDINRRDAALLELYWIKRKSGDADSRQVLAGIRGKASKIVDYLDGRVSESSITELQAALTDIDATVVNFNIGLKKYFDGNFDLAVFYLVKVMQNTSETNAAYHLAKYELSRIKEAAEGVRKQPKSQPKTSPAKDVTS